MKTVFCLEFFKVNHRIFMETVNIIAELSGFQRLVSDWVNTDPLTTDNLSTNHNIY